MIEYENLHKTNQPFFEEYQKAFADVLDRGWFILGEQVKTFEKAFAAYCDTNYCVGLSSGLDALHLAIKAFSFPKGSEVIVPSNTFIATILAILQNNLQPILVEPDITTYNIDPTLIEQYITPKTVAIIPVHLYGKCCEMDKVMQIAKKYQLKVIEDAAQAHGAIFNTQKAGSFGDIGVFSFYPTKNLGALGDAGGAITNDPMLSKALKMLRNYGSQQKYENEIVGYNARLDEVQAAFLNVKLQKLNQINAHKRKLAQIYLSHLKDDFIKPVANDVQEDVYHIFAIRHLQRDAIREYLLKQGIKTEIHYPIPPSKQPVLLNSIGEISTPIAEEIHKTIVSLPIAYHHSEDDIYKVVEVLNSF